MIIDNSYTLLDTIVDKACGKSGLALVERYIKPIASEIFFHPEYLMYGFGPSFAVSGPHEEFFNSSFGIWIGGNNFSGGCSRPIRIHKVWMALRLSQHTVENL